MIDSPLVSIVIPYFNRWDLTLRCLSDLYKFAPEYCEIVLIDDASTEVEAGNGVKWWMENPDRHKIRYYRNPNNIGFGRSNNNGARLARGKYLIFLSNDVLIQDNFIDDMIGLVGESNKTLVAGRVVDWAGG